MTILEILNGLEKSDLARLQCAFESGFSQYVRLPDNKFVGVYVTGIPHLQVEKQVGQWAYGTERKSV